MPRKARQTSVVEFNGRRIVNQNRWGVFSRTEVQYDSNIRVTDDFKALNLWLSPEARTLLPDIYRRAATDFQDDYTMSGEFKGTPKDLLAPYAKRYPTLKASSFPQSEQLFGTLPDGKTTVSLSASQPSLGAKSYLNVTITVTNPKPRLSGGAPSP